MYIICNKMINKTPIGYITCTTPAERDVQIARTCALPTVGPLKSLWLK